MYRLVNQRLFSILRSQICNYGWETELFSPPFTEQSLEILYALSDHHDMAHIVGSALDEHGLLLQESEITKKFRKRQMLAIFRYHNIQNAFETICKALEAERIRFVPLKGAILRDYYPEAWMRTSCDIDILIEPESLEKIKEIAPDRMNATYQSTWHHEHSFFTENGVHIEFHDSLNPDDGEKNAVLENAWAYTVPKEGWNYRLQMTDEMFYFYHIAHMAKHFQEGGCGLRPFLDLWLLDNRVEYDRESRDALLEQGGLLNFTHVARRLAAVWFDGTEMDETSRKMQSYILQGGVYGNLDNRVAIQQNKRGGKIKYILSRIFLPYHTLKFVYPILQKHKWLFPFMQVRRWFRVLFKGRMKRSLREVNTNTSVSQETQSEMAELLQDLGLK